MFPRLIAPVVAALCASVVGAATIQPVEAGLQPLHERIASIDAEVQQLDKMLRESDVPEEGRTLAAKRIESLQLEKRQLETSILDARLFARSPLVMYLAPANE